jgi:hypothetical protein
LATQRIFGFLRFPHVDAKESSQPITLYAAPGAVFNATSTGNGHGFYRPQTTQMNIPVSLSGQGSFNFTGSGSGKSGIYLSYNNFGSVLYLKDNVKVTATGVEGATGLYGDDNIVSFSFFSTRNVVKHLKMP